MSTVEAEQDGGVATAPPPPKERPKPRPSPPKQLPPWKVILHNDDQNFMADVTKALVEVVHLSQDRAQQCMREAHERGKAIVVIVHKERAELYQEGLEDRGLTVTLERA